MGFRLPAASHDWHRDGHQEGLHLPADGHRGGRGGVGYQAGGHRLPPAGRPPTSTRCPLTNPEPSTPRPSVGRRGPRAHPAPTGAGSTACQGPGRRTTLPLLLAPSPQPPACEAAARPRARGAGARPAQGRRLSRGLRPSRPSGNPRSAAGSPAYLAPRDFLQTPQAEAGHDRSSVRHTHCGVRLLNAVLSAGLRARPGSRCAREGCRVVCAPCVCARVRVCAVEQDPAGSPPPHCFRVWLVVLTLRASVCWVLWARKMNILQMAFSFL